MGLGCDDVVCFSYYIIIYSRNDLIAGYIYIYIYVPYMQCSDVRQKWIISPAARMYKFMRTIRMQNIARLACVMSAILMVRYNCIAAIVKNTANINLLMTTRSCASIR